MKQLRIMRSPPHLSAGDAILATLVLFLSTSAGPERIAPFPSACPRYVSLNLRGGRGGLPGGGGQSNDGVGGRRDKPEQPKGRRVRHQPWRISDHEERRQARVRRAREAGWANPQVAADLKDDDMDPRKPRSDRERMIMDAGIPSLSSSDSVETEEYSEATYERLDDFAAILYEAHGPKDRRRFNRTGTAPALKHLGSDLFPDLDVDKIISDEIRPLLEKVLKSPLYSGAI
jgi:hypothetical protein